MGETGRENFMTKTVVCIHKKRPKHRRLLNYSYSSKVILRRDKTEESQVSTRLRVSEWDEKTLFGKQVRSLSTTVG